MQAKWLQGQAGTCGHLAKSLGDVLSPQPAEEADDEVFQGGHDPGRMARTDPGAIFIEGYIADIMEAVFDLPLSPIQLEQPLGTLAPLAKK